MHLAIKHAAQRRTTDTTEREAPALRRSVFSKLVLADDAPLNALRQREQ